MKSLKDKVSKRIHPLFKRVDDIYTMQGLRDEVGMVLWHRIIAPMRDQIVNEVKYVEYNYETDEI